MRTAAPRFLAQAFADLGVTHFFCVPVIVPDAIKEMVALGITPVMAHGEKAAAYMADGYARVSRRPGVCGAQTVGATNLAAGLRDAALARIPVLALTGGKRLETEHRLQYQELDDMPVYAALTKFNAIAWSAARLPDLLADAVRAATTGAPRPVHLELSGITGDVAMAGDVPDIPVPAMYGRCPARRPAAALESVQEALEAIALAERPVIVAGGGVRTSDAGARLTELARHLRLPVATALNAKNTFPEQDPLWIGHVGEYSMTCANRAVHEADLVVYVGSQTGGLVTRTWTIPDRDRTVVHIDIDPENLGRNYPRTIPLCGDARAVLEQLLAPACDARDRPTWHARLAQLRAEWGAIAEPLERSDVLPMHPARLCAELSASLPPDAILVADTGHAGAWLAQHVRALHPGQDFIRAHGSLGWSFPAAIGAKAAAPGRPVVCFTGDGGFYYHLSELETALRNGLDVVVVVNDNASLNQEQFIWQDSSAYDRHWRHEPTDFVAVADAFGCVGLRADRPQDVGPALREAIGCGRPAVVVVPTDVHAVPVDAWGPAGTSGMYPSRDA